MAADRCERAGCDEPVRALGMCSTHYNRERDASRHRHRHDRVLPTRARNRATAALVKAHPDEFARLLDDARKQVEAEHAEFERLAREAGVEPSGVLRLRTGPASRDGESIEDRVRMGDRAICGPCGVFHTTGHACPSCGSKTTSQPLSRLSPRERIERLIRAGKSVQWIAANLGEPQASVRRVLDGMTGREAAS